MAFFEYAISTLDVVPGLIAGAARQVGWIVDEDDGNTYLINPNYYGSGARGGRAARFSVSHGTGTNALNSELSVKVSTSGTLFDKSAFFRSPIHHVNGAATRLMPTKLFVISMLTPEPYIAVVVEYGYNLYRHLYFGFMEKLGTYSGGEVISSCSGPTQTTSSNTRFWCAASDSSANHLMFSAIRSNWSSGSSGGVACEAPDNAAPWREFSASLSSSGINSTKVDAVLGGYGDSYNDALVAKGENSIAGAAILTPVNLLISRQDSQGVTFSPIGNPSGVRMINNRFLEAQARVEVATEVWHTFAATRKTADRLIRYPTQNGLLRVETESSYFLSYAYRSE